MRPLMHREGLIGIAEAMPRGRHHQHAEPHPEIARHDVEAAHVAAMRIDEDQLADAGPMDALADLGPGADDGVRPRGSACPDRRCARSTCRCSGPAGTAPECRPAASPPPPQIAFHDEGVDADGQMRAMLLDGRDRQHRDMAAHVCRAEILPRPLGPELRWDRLVSHGSRPATASISTRNSGRAKPATIISVEAGGGVGT